MNLTLAIETAIGSGSVTLFRDESILTEVKGRCSRAEEVLTAIDAILVSSGTSTHELTTIAVSNGPGSYTGIRVGIATAMGLAAAVGARCVGLCVLDSLLAIYSKDASAALAVVRTGRDELAWRFGLSNEASAGSIAAFAAEIDRFKPKQIIAAGEEIQTLSQGTSTATVEFVAVEAALASVLGQSLKHLQTGPPRPIYLRRAELPANASG